MQISIDTRASDSTAKRKNRKHRKRYWVLFVVACVFVTVAGSFWFSKSIEGEERKNAAARIRKYRFSDVSANYLRVTINDPSFDDADLSSVMNDLKVIDPMQLNLSNTDIREQSFALIAAELPNLNTLDLSNCSLRDNSLAHVAKLRSLTSLNLEHSGVGDEQLVDLKGCRLEFLSVGSAISDASVDTLVSLTELRVLNIKHTHRISLANVRKILASLPKLETLIVKRIRFTQEDVEQLRQEFPKKLHTLD